MNKLTLALSLFGLAVGASGCTIVTPVYGNCDSTAECESLADRCQVLSVTYPDTGATFTEGFCTYGCIDDSDCVTGSTGELGACYTLPDLGPSDAVCYERCLDDLDCTFGFICADTTGGLPGDSICIPG